MPKTRLEKWAVPAVWALLLLGVFETPHWLGAQMCSLMALLTFAFHLLSGSSRADLRCRSHPFEDIGGRSFALEFFLTITEPCAAVCRAADGHREYILSSIPLLPICISVPNSEYVVDANMRS